MEVTDEAVDNEHIEEEDEDKHARMMQYQAKLLRQAEQMSQGSLLRNEWHEIWVAKFALRHSLGRDAGQEIIDWAKQVLILI